MHNDNEVCVVKATIFLNGLVVATGLAEEKKMQAGSIKHQLLKIAKHLQLEEH